MPIRYVVTYDTKMETNIPNFNEELMVHDHEEADTALILNAIDVAQRTPFSHCIVYSPDTDVFLLLIYYYNLLPMATSFRTGKDTMLRDIDIRSCVEAIGENRSKAILGFHTFTGCDQTGHFNRKSKSVWWKSFMEANDSIIQALASLGQNESLPALDTIEELENFVVVSVIWTK